MKSNISCLAQIYLRNHTGDEYTEDELNQLLKLRFSDKVKVLDARRITGDNFVYFTVGEWLLECIRKTENGIDSLYKYYASDISVDLMLSLEDVVNSTYHTSMKTFLAVLKDVIFSSYHPNLQREQIASRNNPSVFFLSGSCTVEIAAFNEFSKFITDEEIQTKYDNIIFDTAPTGHTLRMLQLPSAWDNFISENTHGASCLGQLSGLESQKEVYKKAVATLSDDDLTTLVLVSRPEIAPLVEAERASVELADIGVKNQMLSAKASNEIEWINKVDTHSNGNFAVIPWNTDEIKGENLKTLLS
ncbi:arsenical pump-driving ATPase [Fusibacter sp. 3D3]|nr:arsenical pump-driving ATPase [Fusibacter sp. 3D3]